MYRMRCDVARGYDVRITSGLLDLSCPTLGEAISGRRTLVVIDPAVNELYGARLREYIDDLDAPVKLYVAACSEPTKTMASVLDVCSAAQNHGLGRRDLLVAFGGGVCCDIVSVAATLVRRGIPFLCLPTTLVAQVDAGLGLKGAVNFGGRKNYLGCFTPPELVLIDPTFLRSVEVAELRAGVAEMLKMAILLDATLFAQLRAVGPELVANGFTNPAAVGEELVIRSAELMLDQLALDGYESGHLERLVDFGHTFSGRLEELSGFRLRHGEAVAIDMAITCSIGVDLQLFSDADLSSVLETFTRLGLPLLSVLCTAENLADAMTATIAHRDGELNLVVPTEVGSATFVREVDRVSREVLESAVSRIGRWVSCEANETSVEVPA